MALPFCNCNLILGINCAFRLFSNPICHYHSPHLFYKPKRCNLKVVYSAFDAIFSLFFFLYLHFSFFQTAIFPNPHHNILHNLYHYLFQMDFLSISFGNFIIRLMCLSLSNQSQNKHAIEPRWKVRGLKIVTVFCIRILVFKLNPDLESILHNTKPKFSQALVSTEIPGSVTLVVQEEGCVHHTGEGEHTATP